MNFDTNWLFVIAILMVILSLFVPAPTDKEIQKEKKEQEIYEQQQRWNAQKSRFGSDISRYSELEPEQKSKPEPETHMQRFHRENSMEECVKRGGFLTTGERMEAMYGACEEATECFPEDYDRERTEND